MVRPDPSRDANSKPPSVMGGTDGSALRAFRREKTKKNRKEEEKVNPQTVRIQAKANENIPSKKNLKEFREVISVLGKGGRNLEKHQSRQFEKRIWGHRNVNVPHDKKTWKVPSEPMDLRPKNYFFV